MLLYVLKAIRLKGEFFMLQSIRWLIPNMTDPTWTDVVVALAIVLLTFIVQQYVLKPLFARLTQSFEAHNQPFFAALSKHFSRMFRHALFVASFFAAASYLVEVWLLNIPVIESAFYSLMFFFVFKGVYDLLSYYTLHPVKLPFHEEREEVLAPYLLRIIKATVVGIGVFSIAALWNFNINGFLTGIGLTGVALAFGVRDTSSHIFGGLSVGLDKPFQVGDWIATDDQKLDGVVEDINLRSTLINAGDKGSVYVPNAYLMNRPIYNYSKRTKMKTEMYLYVATTNEESKLRTACEEIHEQIMLHAQTENDVVHVFIDQYRPTSFRLLVRFFVATDSTATNLAVRQDILFAIHDIFKRYNIEHVEQSYEHVVE